jgi:hypothetical protein
MGEVYTGESYSIGAPSRGLKRGVGSLPMNKITSIYQRYKFVKDFGFITTLFAIG